MAFRRVLIVCLLVMVSACGGSTTVLDVNGTEVSRDELDELIDARLEPVDGSVPSGDVASLLTLQVVVAVTEQQLAVDGIDISDADVRAEYDRLIEVNGSAGAPEFEEIRDELFLELAISRVFDTEQELIDALGDAEVTVDPRYGSWTGVEAGVIPPDDPAS